MIYIIHWVQSQSNKQKKVPDYKNKNQNRINMYVLPFKAMQIMASCYFFIYMFVKKFKPKIHLIEILILILILKL